MQVDRHMSVWRPLNSRTEFELATGLQHPKWLGLDCGSFLTSMGLTTLLNVKTFLGPEVSE